MKSGRSDKYMNVNKKTLVGFEPTHLYRKVIHFCYQKVEILRLNRSATVSFLFTCCPILGSHIIFAEI